MSTYKETPQPHSRIYDELKAIKPWELRIDEGAVEDVLHLVVSHPFLEGFFNQRLLKALAEFPPDSRYFSNPVMSLASPLVWVTITERHIRLRVKAEYRKVEQVCWVVEVHAEPIA